MLQHMSDPVLIRPVRPDDAPEEAAGRPERELGFTEPATATARVGTLGVRRQVVNGAKPSACTTGVNTAATS